MGKRTAGAVMVAVGLLAGVLVSEALLAVVFPQPTYRRIMAASLAMHEPDTLLGHSLRAGYQGRFTRPEFDTHVTVGRDGFRVGGSGGEGPRVMVLGDSFTFGHGVEDGQAYPAVLDSLLPEVTVVNGGFVARSSPDSYYTWLRGGRLGPGYSVLLVGFFVGNDIEGREDTEWLELDEDSLPARIGDPVSTVVDGYLEHRTVPIGYRYPVLRNSELFHLAGRAYRALQNRNRPKRTPDLFRDEWPPMTRHNVAKTERVFKGLFHVADTLGLEVGVVMIPTLQQVTGEHSAKVQEEFGRFFTEQGVPYLDLLPPMKGQPDLYFPTDQHWNAKGQRVAAERIAAWYRATGFTPREGR